MPPKRKPSPYMQPYLDLTSKMWKHADKLGLKRDKKLFNDIIKAKSSAISKYKSALTKAKGEDNIKQYKTVFSELEAQALKNMDKLK